MENNTKAPFAVDYDLSSICKKEIRISRENLKEHMRQLRSIFNSEDYSITLTSLKSIEVLPTNISMIVQDDRLVVAWDAKKYHCRMFSKAINIIGGFYSYMEEVWASIPDICKKDDWKKKQFSKMIDILA